MKTQNIINSAKRAHSFGIIDIFKLLICELLVHTLLISRPHISISSIRKLSATNNKQKLANRWHLSAEGFLLLPSALRPHLLGKKCKKYGFRDIFRDKIVSNYAKNHQKLQSFAKINGKLAKNTHFLAILALFQIVAMSTIFGYFCSTPASAASLTLTVPTKLSLDINPNTNNGFANTSANVSISTTAPWGYELSVKAKDTNTLKNGSSTISSITTSIDENTFKSGTTYNNKWGFKPSKVNGENNTNYITAPTSSNSAVIEKTSSSNSSATNYTIAIGAKADSTLASGAYSNNFILSATANTVSYSITYNLNEGTWGSTSPQTGSTTEKTITLDTHSPTRSNYTFEGWCSTSVTDNSGTNPTCSGTKYSAGGSYTLSSSTNTLSLYAIWKDARYLGDLGTMQKFSCSKISKTEGYGTVTDSRGNSKYKVAKLKDGKCWMIENLRIAGKTIDSTDSDMTSDLDPFQIPDSNLSTFNVGGSGWSFSPNNNAAYDDSQWGGLYTWNVATAGTGASVTSNGANASSSICPKGWKLPSSGSSSSGDFAELVNAYGGNNSNGSAALRATPVPGFTYAGRVLYGNGQLYDQGSYGYYWSSTSNDNTYAYILYLNSSGANPANDYYRVYGFSVRCLAR